MRKLLYLLVMCFFALWGCNKNDDIKNPEDPDNTTNVYLEVYPSELVFEALGGEQSVRIGCFDDDANAQKWMITGGGEWCKTDVSEGNGYGEVTVIVDAYSETQDRNTNLTIKAGDKSYVLTVTQKHGDAIVLSRDKFDVPEEGGTVTVEVKSNIEYEVEVPNEFQDWIKQAPESRAVTEKSFTFTISENEDYNKREGYILFSGDSREDTVFIYQAQKNQLVLTKNVYNLQSAGGDIVVELKTNIDYDVHILDDATSWISPISTKAIREDRLKFQVAANTGNDERIARIVIQDKNSDLSDTVRVTQVSKDTYGGDLVWETEQDLIDFCTAGHTKVIGNIVVQGDEIETLARLYNILAEIDGSITFNCETLSSFDGLYGLKKISGDLIIQEGVMTFFKGLWNLGEIGGSFKVISSSLPCLTSFNGLESLKRIGGDFEVNASIPDWVPSSSSLKELSSFEGLEGLEEIGGSFKVIASSHFSQINNYTFFSSSSLSSLTSFGGLKGLKRIGGDFEVNASSFGTSGPSSCASSYSLNSLSSFVGLESLEEIGGSFKVVASSSTSVSSSSSAAFSLSSLTSFNGLSALKRIGGDFEMNASSSGSAGGSSSSLNSLSSFEGLEGLEEMKKLTIKNCVVLNNINALSKVDTLDGIYITGCLELYDFCVLKNAVQHMSNAFTIEKNGYNPTKEQLLNGECSK